MTDPISNPEHFTQHSKPRSRLALWVAGALALFLVGGALTLVVLGMNDNDNTSEAATDIAYSTIPFDGPKHMSTGGVIFGNDMQVMSSPALTAGSVPSAGVPDRASGAVDVVIYVDYRCPHCMMFEQTNSELLKEVANAQNATVEIRPLTFMDRFAQGSAYSSRAANVLACTVENQPEHAWLMHSLLLNPNVQPEGEGPGHDNEMFVELADQLLGGASGELKNCITNDKYVPFVGAINDWVFQYPVQGSVNNSVMVGGTPTVIVGGIEFTGDLLNTSSLRAFFIENGIAID